MPVAELYTSRDQSLQATADGQERKASCPVCGSNCDDPPLYEYTAEEAAAHFCTPTRNSERNRRLKECILRLWQGSTCVILRCRECGFAFGSPFVGGDEEFYCLLHEQRGYPAWRWDYDIAITEAVNKFNGGRILDIGAGVGNFLKRLDRSWERYALEGSDLTRGDLESAGLRVFRDLGEAADLHAGEFQVITIFQVLEHLAEFELVLSQCRRLLGADGRLVVTVPDGDAMIRQECLTGCADMPPNHLSKWTPSSLGRILSSAGFEVGKVVAEPHSWRNVVAAIHLKVMADAAKGRPMSAQVYAIKNKRFRVFALAMLGVPAFVKLVRHLRPLSAGGAFAIVGVAR